MAALSDTTSRAGGPPFPGRRWLVIRAQHTAVRVALPLYGTIRVGSSEDADVCVPEDQVAPVHVTLHLDPELEADLQDADSGLIRRGTRTEVPLARGSRVRLAPGDELRLGSVVLTSVEEPAPAAGGGELAGGVTGPMAPLQATPAHAHGMLVRDPAMREVLRLVERLAESSSPVLVLGETGTGKDLIARMLHDRSSRAPSGFVRVSCADLEEGGRSEPSVVLLEAIGRAAGGTVLLDEVGALGRRAQLVLNGLIETAEARFVATSNHDLRAEVQRGAFRKDLYFRLSRLVVVVPPLAERSSEILPLAEHFLAVFTARLGRPEVPRLSAAAKAKLEAHGWPGNVRELAGVIERALFVTSADVIGAESLELGALGAEVEAGAGVDPGGAEPDEAGLERPGEAAARGERPRSKPGVTAPPLTLREEMAALERSRISEALERYQTQAEAAKALDIPLRTFLNRLDALGIPRPRKPKD